MILIQFSVESLFFLLVDAVVALVGHFRLEIPCSNVENLLGHSSSGDVVIGQFEFPSSLARLKSAMDSRLSTVQFTYDHSIVAVVVDLKQGHSLPYRTYFETKLQLSHLFRDPEVALIGTLRWGSMVVISVVSPANSNRPWASVYPASSSSSGSGPKLLQIDIHQQELLPQQITYHKRESHRNRHLSVSREPQMPAHRHIKECLSPKIIIFLIIKTWIKSVTL